MKWKGSKVVHMSAVGVEAAVAVECQSQGIRKLVDCRGGCNN